MFSFYSVLGDLVCTCVSRVALTLYDAIRRGIQTPDCMPTHQLHQQRKKKDCTTTAAVVLSLSEREFLASLLRAVCWGTRSSKVRRSGVTHALHIANDSRDLVR